MALGARIKQARGTLDQSILCAMVNERTPEGGKLLSQQSLSNLETRDSLTSEFALRIADALGVSVRWLLDGEGPQQAPEWPFLGVARSEIDALTPHQLGFIEGVLRSALEKLKPDNPVERERAREQAALDAKVAVRRKQGEFLPKAPGAPAPKPTQARSRAKSK